MLINAYSEPYLKIKKFLTDEFFDNSIDEALSSLSKSTKRWKLHDIIPSLEILLKDPVEQQLLQWLVEHDAGVILPKSNDAAAKKWLAELLTRMVAITKSPT